MGGAAGFQVPRYPLSASQYLMGMAQGHLVAINTAPIYETKIFDPIKHCHPEPLLRGIRFYDVQYATKSRFFTAFRTKGFGYETFSPAMTRFNISGVTVPVF
jgi:hypothetical protein